MAAVASYGRAWGHAGSRVDAHMYVFHTFVNSKFSSLDPLFHLLISSLDPLFPLLVSSLDPLFHLLVSSLDPLFPLLVSSLDPRFPLLAAP